MCETRRAVFLRLGYPVLRLVCRFEGGVFSDGCICIFVDFFDVIGADTGVKIRCELLLESIIECLNLDIL
jgi:hypothetical protein